ncbi:MAG TPA: citrate synthase/methylcitrate synthase [Alphaproteobacteria bacterium]|nr:citrate synthase/methylcitrate synthase [Alphaproteobacteria bacterium]
MDAGLEGIVAAETVLSNVDGERGRLIIRGHEVGELAQRASFEEVVHLLWQGFFAELPSQDALARRIGEARARVFQKLPRPSSELLGLGPVRILRVLLALLSDDESLDCAIELAAAPAVITAWTERARHHMPLNSPDPAQSHAADFLTMLSGHRPSAAEERALNSYLATICDHGLNASTFAARVVASTRAGLGSAVVAGLSALKGPLHGGAPGPVLDMIDAIGTAANATRWIEAALDRGERLMGFGHRVYRVRDPRADALKATVQKLPREAGRLAMAEEIERVSLKELALRKPDRKLDTNVEFYTALLLEALQVPREAFTCVFAMGRVAGWIAHAKEQIATGRIVRPQSAYVGPVPQLVS